MKPKEKMMQIKEKAANFVDDHETEICVGVSSIISYVVGCLFMGALKDHEYRWARAIDNALDVGVGYAVYAVDKAHTGAEHNWVYIMSNDDKSRFQRTFEEK